MIKLNKPTQTSGDVINRQCNNDFYKILNKDYSHDNIILNDNTNIILENDLEKYDDLYFTNKNDIYSCIEEDDSTVCKIIVDNDACVYKYDIDNIMYFKATNIIVKDICNLQNSYLFDSEEKCNNAVIKNGLLIKFISYDYQTNDLIQKSITQNYNALKYIDINKQSNDIIMFAIRRNYKALEHVHESKQSEEIIKLALIENKNCIDNNYSNKVILFNVLKFVHNQSTNICKFAIDLDYTAIIFIREQNEDICKYAFDKNKNAIMYVKNKTTELSLNAINIDWKLIIHIEDKEEVYIKALQRDYRALKLIRKRYQNKNIIKTAIKINKKAVEFIKNKTLLTEDFYDFLFLDCTDIEIFKLSVINNPKSIKYIKSEYQTDEICKLVLEKDALLIKYIFDQKIYFCRMAINKNYYAIHFIKNKTNELKQLRDERALQLRDKFFG